MKFKPTKDHGRVLVELGPREAQLPVQPEGERARSSPVFRLKKILVPVDFSGCAEKALNYAIPLASQFAGELLLLHVIPPPLPLPDMGPVDVETVEGAQRDMEALEKKLGGLARFRAVLSKGDPAVEIVKAAADLGADLIVLSTHGRTGLAHVLLGSTAERVVRRAGCPVLIVREHEHEFITSNALQGEDAVVL